MSQGNDFANYSSPVDASATPPEDLWYVAVASDDIKQMTLDQLDEAYRLGVISSKTPVWTEGMEAWSPLGEVADLDGDDSDAAEAMAAEQAAPAHSSVFETPLAASPLLSSAPSFPPGPSSFAPVTSSFGPSASSSLLSGSGPVALEIDEDMAPGGRRRRFRIERWLLAAAAIAGLGVTAYNNTDLFAASAAPSVASVGDTSSSQAFAARPYDVGSTSEPAAEAAAPSKPEPTAKAADEGDAPIATAASSADDRKEADAEEAEEGEAERDEPAAKSKLKKRFSKAFKSSKRAKKASRSRARASKAKKASSRASAKSAKKSGAPRAASAFDPLNASLP